MLKESSGEDVSLFSVPAKKHSRIINSASGFHTLSGTAIEVSTVQLLEMVLGGRSAHTCNKSLWKLLEKLLVASTGFGAGVK